MFRFVGPQKAAFLQLNRSTNPSVQVLLACTDVSDSMKPPADEEKLVEP